MKRVFAIIKKRFIQYLPPTFNQEIFENVGISPQIPFLNHDIWNHATKLKQGKFCFLNQTANLCIPIDWNGSKQSFALAIQPSLFSLLAFIGF